MSSYEIRSFKGGYLTKAMKKSVNEEKDHHVCSKEREKSILSRFLSFINSVY